LITASGSRIRFQISHSTNEHRARHPFVHRISAAAAAERIRASAVACGSPDHRDRRHRLWGGSPPRRRPTLKTPHRRM